MIGHPDHRFHCHEFGAAVRFSITFLFALACCVLAWGQIAEPSQETTTIHMTAEQDSRMS
jgi:hypothetical protein